MLLQDVLGYVQGIDFEVTAFQATNAADVGGLTLHTACGLNREKDCLDTACRPDTARRIAFWRWLFIDEVGMVSARLLAQVDLRIRGAVPAAAQWKYNDGGTCSSAAISDNCHRRKPASWPIFPSVDAAEQSSRKRCPRRSRAEHRLADRRSARAMQGRLSRHKTSNVIKASRTCSCSSPRPPSPPPNPPTASPAWAVTPPPRSWSRCAPAVFSRTTATISTAVPSKAATCRRTKSVRGNEWWTGPGTRACKRRSSSTPLSSCPTTMPSTRSTKTARWPTRNTPRPLWSGQWRKTQQARRRSKAQVCDKEAKIRWLQYHDMDTEGLPGMLPGHRHARGANAARGPLAEVPPEGPHGLRAFLGLEGQRPARRVVRLGPHATSPRPGKAFFAPAIIQVNRRTRQGT